MLPILLNHDPQKAIGTATWTDGRFVIEMQPAHALTRAQIFAMFGYAGIRVLEQEATATWVDKLPTAAMRVRKFEVLEFSLCPAAADVAPTKILRAFQPGDVVIIECNGAISDEHALRLKQYAEQATGLKVLVLGDGMRVVGREEGIDITCVEDERRKRLMPDGRIEERESRDQSSSEERQP